MKTAPRPLYSLNLAPSDFCLFGSVKGCLSGLSFESADELLEAVQGVLDGIDERALQLAFLR
jgi:hypothetical protein